MKKRFALQLIQTAWVMEVIAVLGYTMLIVPLLTPERIGLWVSMLPHILGIIGSQGAAAGIGPLASDFIKSRTKEDYYGNMPGYTRPAPTAPGSGAGDPETVRGGAAPRNHY